MKDAVYFHFNFKDLLKLFLELRGSLKAQLHGLPLHPLRIAGHDDTVSREGRCLPHIISMHTVPYATFVVKELTSEFREHVN